MTNETNNPSAQDIEAINQGTCHQLVEREVIHCASYMMSSLLQSENVADVDQDDLFNLCESFESWQETFENNAPDDCTVEFQGETHFIPEDYRILVYVVCAGEDTKVFSCLDDAWVYLEDLVPADDDETLATVQSMNWNEPGDVTIAGKSYSVIEDETHTQDDADIIAAGIADELIVLDFDDAYEQVCNDELGIYDRDSLEVLEHWIVTSWFAHKLQEHGQVVGEVFDFYIWGRTCSGQSIAMDGIIRSIADSMEILHGQKNDWSK